MKKESLYAVSLFVLIAISMMNKSSVAEENAPDEALTEAKEKFERGLELFQEGEFSTAIESFQESFALVPRASTLFNIGMSQKAVSLDKEAISTFEKFLNDYGDECDKPMKIDAKAALYELKESIEKGERNNNTPPQPTPPQPPPKVLKVGIFPSAPLMVKNERKHSPLFVTGLATGGLGFVGLGIGAYFNVKWYQDYEDGKEIADECHGQPENAPCHDQYSTIQSRTKDEEKGIYAGYIAGGILMATGFTLILIDKYGKKESSGSSTKPLAFSVTPGGMAVNF